MLTDAEGEIGDAIHLVDQASKGSSGRVIPLNKELKAALVQIQKAQVGGRASPFAVTTERARQTSAAAIVNLFAAWYLALGFNGCSSHSGRRGFITNAARKISTVGGSLRDVQFLAGHSSLSTTQRYIEATPTRNGGSLTWFEVSWLGPRAGARSLLFAICEHPGPLRPAALNAA